MRFGAIIMIALAFATPLLMIYGESAPGALHAQLPLPKEPLTIQTTTGPVSFEVEVARTKEQQQTGLMFRKSLPPLGGMIFPFQPARSVSFWMKNTVIALDMIFIRPDGTIARIITAQPLQEKLDASGEPVAAVLEIAAGQAQRRGIQVGDKVRWRGLSTQVDD